MKLSQRLVSGLTIASVALSATPAFAASIGLGTSADVNAGASVSGLKNHRVEIDSHSNADVHMSSRIKLNGLKKVVHGKGDENRLMNGTGSVVARHESKIDRALSVAARISAHFSKKICALLGDDEGTSLSACMADRKAKIKAAFSLKLDAAFGG